MGHLTYGNYRRMQRRLNQYVPGNADSTSLYEILKVLVTDEEAHLCSLMPVNLTASADLARIWKMAESEAVSALDALAHKGIVYVFDAGGTMKYALAPPVLGFFEFSLMRTDGRFDAETLSKLYYQYNNVEEGFIRQQGAAWPSFTRVLPHEDMLEDLSSEVMSWERVSDGIDSATCITTGQCFCRHKMEHMGLACDAPMDVCLTFNDTAKYLSTHGIAREISRDEARRIIRECMDAGLVQIGENKKSNLVIICNCCGCCCDLLLGYKKFGLTDIVSPSSYVATVESQGCSRCGTCAERCPVDAITQTEAQIPVVGDRCLGCGVCTRFCPTGSCRLAGRPEKIYVPEDFLEKWTLGGIHQAKLGNFFFDDQTSSLHRILRVLTNATLRLPFLRSFLLSRPVRTALMSAIRNSRRFREFKDPAPPAAV
ncbi:MAG: hypothetical protein FJ109_00195 [Deltaproteobacteria bacterium]|nr:hypothetical protein [Deltaproteobacteria bacterium]